MQLYLIAEELRKAVHSASQVARAKYKKFQEERLKDEQLDTKQWRGHRACDRTCAVSHIYFGLYLSIWVRSVIPREILDANSKLRQTALINPKTLPVLLRQSNHSYE